MQCIKLYTISDIDGNDVRIMIIIIWCNISKLWGWKSLNQGRLPIAELKLVPSRRQHSLNNNLSERFISLGLLRLVIIITGTFSSALNRSVLPTAWVGPFETLCKFYFLIDRSITCEILISHFTVVLILTDTWKIRRNVKSLFTKF